MFSYYIAYTNPVSLRTIESHSRHIYFHRLPIELQLEEVDMNDEDMDMLEWMVRRTIPIPKQYYWETGNTDLPYKTRQWHNIVGGLSGAVKWLDRIGKPVVEATGLTSSRFADVESTMSERQKSISKLNASTRKLKIEASRRDLMVEEGRAAATGDDDDDADECTE